MGDCSPRWLISGGAEDTEKKQWQLERILERENMRKGYNCRMKRQRERESVLWEFKRVAKRNDSTA